jgi:hypothetical protein
VDGGKVMSEEDVLSSKKTLPFSENEREIKIS